MIRLFFYPLLALALSAALPDGQNVRNEGGAELPVVQEEVVPFMNVEEKPAFKGGDMNMFIKWMGTQLVCPQNAGGQKLKGRVVVLFTVGSDGSVSNVEVVRSSDQALEQEALRVVGSSPKWTPGRQGGKPVAVRCSVPVIFQ